MSSVVIKLGSSVVADDDGTVRIDVLQRICEDVALLYARGYEPIIVTSGAIARVTELSTRTRKSFACPNFR